MNTTTRLLERVKDILINDEATYSKEVALEDIEAYLAKQQESASGHKEGVCINGCKEVCTYCLIHYGKP
jgi:tRNA A37 methylthiotransferase MiaB